jgi:hypothetical protein
VPAGRAVLHPGSGGGIRPAAHRAHARHGLLLLALRHWRAYRAGKQSRRELARNIFIETASLLLVFILARFAGGLVAGFVGAGMSAYYLSKRREEEEAQRAAVHAQFTAEQAEKERQQKVQAKVMAKLEKQWAEERRKEQAYQQWKEEQEQAVCIFVPRMWGGRQTAPHLF